MTIESIITNRKIKEVYHFTTNIGLLGILSTKNLLPRAALKDNQTLEYILKYNSPYRSDPDWVNYINLSISRINQHLFDKSTPRHKDPHVFWVIIGLDASIMAHKNVYFTTTNNIYPACKRGQGHESLEKLFAPTILGRYSSVVVRKSDHPDHWTTCPQAELLYPAGLSTDFITAIYVKNDADSNAVNAQIAALCAGPYTVRVAPEKFQNTDGNL